MFDIDALPSPSAIAAGSLSDALRVMGEAQRLERAATARRLLAVARVFLLREAEKDAKDRSSWRIDGWSGVAAEVSAQLSVSKGKADYMIRTATQLVERLPKVAEVFADGLVDYWIVACIVSRVLLIMDDEKLASVDAALAARVARWNKLSAEKVSDLIDVWVITVDPVAKRQARSRDEGRHFGVGADAEGVSEIWGSVRSTDAAAIDARLAQLAATVCPNDPRTLDQRRADAAGAWAAGQTCLVCECEEPDCPAAGQQPGPSAVVVHVIADEASVSGGSPIPGYIRGWGALPPEMLRNVLRTATVKPLVHPGPADSEAGYRPSVALAEFVRCRDLTCRFPGCHEPADVCDIDHTVPHPVGPTHASNLKMLCRHHHLLKTFHTGPNGWSDRQLPDGVVEWTSPSGQVYTKQPGGALFFPQFAVPTGKLILPAVVASNNPGRGLLMPRRNRTRKEDRQARIDYERAQNAARYAADPPPF